MGEHVRTAGVQMCRRLKLQAELRSPESLTRNELQIYYKYWWHLKQPLSRDKWLMTSQAVQNRRSPDCAKGGDNAGLADRWWLRGENDAMNRRPRDGETGYKSSLEMAVPSWGRVCLLKLSPPKTDAKPATLVICSGLQQVCTYPIEPVANER